MPGPAAPADDSVRDSNNSAHGAPITPLLKAELPKLNSELARKVRDVVARKGRPTS
jgi:hypothetical protein